MTGPARALLRQKVPGAVLIVASTHDHEGPDTMGLWGEGRFSSGVDPQYLDRVRRTIAETATEALGRLKPGRLVLGKARTPGLIEDGRLPTVIDDTLVALQVVGKDGATLGTVIDWSSHPEALGGKNTLVTSDFPHYLRARMEERLGGTSVFLVGSIGGLMTPLGLKLTGADGRPVPADSFALAQAVGERAADAALAALREGRPSASSALEHRSATVFVLSRTGSSASRCSSASSTGGSTAAASPPRRSSATTFDRDRLPPPRRRGGAPRAAEIYRSSCSAGSRTPGPRRRLPGRAARAGALSLLSSSTARRRPRQRRDRIRHPARAVGREGPFAYGRKEEQYGEVNSVGPSAATRPAEAFERLVGR
jgi:hypothetical protein